MFGSSRSQQPSLASVLASQPRPILDSSCPGYTGQVVQGLDFSFLTISSFVFFRECSFINCYVNAAQLAHCYFERCSFTKCSLIRTSFEYSILVDTNFFDCDLTEAKFNRAVIHNVKLGNCKVPRISTRYLKGWSASDFGFKALELGSHSCNWFVNESDVIVTIDCCTRTLSEWRSLSAVDVNSLQGPLATSHHKWGQLQHFSLDKIIQESLTSGSHLNLDPPSPAPMTTPMTTTNDDASDLLKHSVDAYNYTKDYLTLANKLADLIRNCYVHENVDETIGNITAVVVKICALSDPAPPVMKLVRRNVEAQLDMSCINDRYIAVQSKLAAAERAFKTIATLKELG